MRKIGILGGLSPESTLIYYKKLVDGITKRTGGKYPEIILYSLPMDKALYFQQQGDYSSLAAFIRSRLNLLENAGVQIAAIASNTPHIVFDDILKTASIPLINIVEETGKYIASVSSAKKVALLGTAFTMRESFYRTSFKNLGLEIFTPESKDIDFINEVIFTELAHGIIREESKAGILNIIWEMFTKHEIKSIVLGCTELPLILTENYFGLEYFDTIQIHVDAIIRESLKP